MIVNIVFCLYSFYMQKSQLNLEKCQKLCSLHWDDVNVKLTQFVPTKCWTNKL